jgi:hypothetical protein
MCSPCYYLSYLHISFLSFSLGSHLPTASTHFARATANVLGKRRGSKVQIVERRRGGEEAKKKGGKKARRQGGKKARKLKGKEVGGKKARRRGGKLARR